MRKQNFFTKVLLLALPATIASSVILAQSTAKIPGNKTVQAAQAEKAAVATKHEANQLPPQTTSRGERPCYKTDKSKANIITQEMLRKMPKDRQEFVKSNPQRFTIVQ